MGDPERLEVALAVAAAALGRLIHALRLGLREGERCEGNASHDRT